MERIYLRIYWLALTLISLVALHFLYLRNEQSSSSGISMDDHMKKAWVQALENAEVNVFHVREIEGNYKQKMEDSVFYLGYDTVVTRDGIKVAGTRLDFEVTEAQGILKVRVLFDDASIITKDDGIITVRQNECVIYDAKKRDIKRFTMPKRQETF